MKISDGRRVVGPGSPGKSHGWMELKANRSTELERQTGTRKKKKKKKEEVQYSTEECWPPTLVRLVYLLVSLPCIWNIYTTGWKIEQEISENLCNTELIIKVHEPNTKTVLRWKMIQNITYHVHRSTNSPWSSSSSWSRSKYLTTFVVNIEISYPKNLYAALPGRLWPKRVMQMPASA